MIIKGKTAVVTGASRGIGKAIAIELAKAGANIAVIYGSSEPSEVMQQLEALGVTAKAYKCDVSDFNLAKTTADSIIKDFGVVDVLINNAGITADNLILRMSENDWDKVLDVNLKGAFNMIKHFSQNFLRARGGAIINVSSVSGLMGNAGQANYAASKAGLIGLTKSVARELGSRGVTCNAVCPGYIETDMTAALSAEAQENIKRNIPLSRCGKAEEIAAAVVFLATNRYITGEYIKVDGGMYI